MSKVSEFFKNNGPATVIISLLISLITALGTIYINVSDSDIRQNESTTNSSTTNVENCLTLFNELKAEFNILKEENRELLVKIKSLEAENIMFQTNNLIFNNPIDDFPFPIWIKSRDGVMIKINKSYERQYLIPKGLTKNEYINKSDYEIWTKEEAERFRANDLTVIKTGTMLRKKETFVVRGVKLNVTVYKFPIFANNSDFVIGVGGIILQE